MGALLAALALLLIAPAQADDKQAAAAYNAAAGLFNTQLWGNAAKGYEEYLKNHPRHELVGHGHYGLGLCYFNLKRYDEAAAQLTKAINSKGPDKATANLILGQALLNQKTADPKKAEAAFDRSLKSLGLVKTGLLNRSWNEEKVSAWVKANEDEDKLKDAASAVQGLVDALYMRQEWKPLISVNNAFATVVKESDAQQRMRVMTGEAHERTGNFKAAAVAYEAAANQKGGDAAEALFRLGRVRLDNLRAYKKAAENFEDFIEQHRNSPLRADAAFNEALCYYQGYYGGNAGHLAKAVDKFTSFAKDHSKHKLANIARFYAGQLEHARENWEGALEALEPLLDEEATPAMAQLVFMVGDSHHRMKNWKKAAEFYTEFAKDNETALNGDVALHNAGVAYRNMNPAEDDKAIAVYEQLEAKCPTSRLLPSARLELGILHYRAGRFAKARQPLSKIPAGHALKADAEYFLAWADLDDKQPANAAKRFGLLADQLGAKDKTHRLVALARLYQGIGEYEGGNFADAAGTLAKFVANFPEHDKFDEGAFNLGLSQMELKKWAAAIDSFKTVPAGSDLRDRALYQAAWSQRFAGKGVDAIPLYEELLEKHADSNLTNNVMLELAEVEFEAGGEDAGGNAVKRLQALLEKNPNAELKRLANYRLGIAYFSQKEYSDSAKAFEAVMADAPGNLLVSAAWQAGEARRQVAMSANGNAREDAFKASLKNYHAAINAKLQGADGNSAELQKQAVLRAGQVQASLEDWEASQAEFDKFIAGNPRHNLVRTAHLGLGWALQNQEKHDAAIKSFEKAVADDVRDETGARAQFLLGECYFELENFDKAVIEFAKTEALYKFPQWQSKAIFEMARALARQNKPALAKRQYQRLVDTYPETQAAKAAKQELNRLN
jgi:TolA-binding protein